MDAAVAYVVALQEAAGIDVVSDGEWRRRSYIGVIAEIMHGFARETRDGLSWHTVVEPMTPRRPGLARRGGALPGRPHPARHQGRPALALPAGPAHVGPGALARPRIRTREAFMRALVPVLRARAARGARGRRHGGPVRRPAPLPAGGPEGARRLRRPGRGGRALRGPAQRDRGRRRRHRDRGAPLPPQQGAPGLDRRGRLRPDPAVPAAPRGATVRAGVHHPGGGRLRGAAAAARTIARSASAAWTAAARTSTRPEAIAERVGQALRHVDAERLWLNPDCGFAPGSAADIPIDEAYAKLRNEAAAAALLRARFP